MQNAKDEVFVIPSSKTQLTNNNLFNHSSHLHPFSSSKIKMQMVSVLRNLEFYLRPNKSVYSYQLKEKFTFWMHECLYQRNVNRTCTTVIHIASTFTKHSNICEIFETTSFTQLLRFHHHPYFTTYIWRC